MRAEQHGFSVGRRHRVPERFPGAIVEEIGIAGHQPWRAAAGGNRHDVVIDPPFVELDEENGRAIGREGRVDVVSKVGGEASHLRGRDGHGPDVVRAVTITGEGDGPAIRRPGHRIDPGLSEPGELDVAAVRGGPKPDFGRAALAGGVGDPIALWAPGRQVVRLIGDCAEIRGESKREAAVGLDAPKAGCSAERRLEHDGGAVRAPLVLFRPDDGVDGEDVVGRGGRVDSRGLGGGDGRIGDDQGESRESGHEELPWAHGCWCGAERASPCSPVRRNARSSAPAYRVAKVRVAHLDSWVTPSGVLPSRVMLMNLTYQTPGPLIGIRATPSVPARVLCSAVTLPEGARAP